MSTAYVVQHVAFEDLGVLAGLVPAAGFSVCSLDAGLDDLGRILPAAQDLLIVLGGPIGAYEDDRYPFLLNELKLIETALGCGARVLGICLGAQLLARVLGARVYPGPTKEIGFGPVRLTPAGMTSCLKHLKNCDYNVMHWHGDTFDLPAGAQRLASTDLTPNQAFSLDSQILALQFHIEADPRTIERWLIGHTSELTTAGIDIGALRQAAATSGTAIAQAGELAVGDWLSETLPVERQSMGG